MVWSPFSKKAIEVAAPCEQRPGYKTCSQKCTALVTGSSGLCGARIVELLLERGATKVLAFDLVPPNAILQERFDCVQKETGGTIVVYAGKEEGNLLSDAAVEKVFADHQIDVVFHIAALVGPFYDYHTYMAVNRDATIRIIDNCKKYKVPKLVYSSSPSTRMSGADIMGLTEDQLPFPQKYMAMYAETKAYGEMAVTAACSDELMTISVAPHQVYGPHDTLFLPNLLEAGWTGRLRIFGPGHGKISTCYVDNYAHGCLCGADALYPNSPALAKFYIVTDGDEPVKIWEMINEAVVAMGFCDLNTKFHLPIWFLYILAYIANVVGWILGRKFKLNPFNVRVMTMHRYFSIQNAKRDLHYEPLYTFQQAWPLTLQWFQEHWLPAFLEKNKKQAPPPPPKQPISKDKAA